ncbi:MAG TPA: VWA domain-containing protein [Pyrinomonadaceae bacterium]|nr:VWA domain-containing protein [Pyrinomonadaceae bacterium]
MMYPTKKLVSTLASALSLLMFVSAASGQQQQTRQPSTAQSDDVIRINTELVQTDVMVLDRQGRFVDGLRPEEFELSLDGKPQAVSFFERVATGSATEAAQLAAARGGAKAANAVKSEKPVTTTPAAESRGRVIFFFLDDVHMSGESVTRARKALLNYVDNRMSWNDQVAIVSTSGQIGFLQQLTDNRVVLHTAINRLNYKMNPEAYTGKTRISEYLASQVEDYANRELFAYLMESVKMEQQMGAGLRKADHRLASTYSASPMLRNRIRQVNSQGRMTTADTFDALRGLIASSAPLPGRKVVFFLSDGFIVNERKAGALEALHHVTKDAARAGVVVYTMDLRGTVFGLGSGVDASSNDYVDLTGRKAGLLFGEISATQEPLKIIADETGGRAILNSNSIDDGIRQAINETSRYYLLAWRPDGEAERDGKLRLKVSIKDRPELRVRLRNSFYETPVKAAVSAANKPGESSATARTASAESRRPAEAELLTALGALYPHKQLPLSVSAGYVNTPSSGVLRISMQIEREAFNFDSESGAQKAEVDVIGTAIDDRGIIKTFKQVVTVTPDLLAQKQNIPVIWNQQLPLPPGLYQVRVAVRERATARTGSAQQWIEVPDPAGGRFSLSTLFLGERKPGESIAAKGANGPQAIMVDVDHHFPRTSVLRYQIYVYNAARTTAAAASASPDVWIQTQVLQGDRQIVSIPASKVPTEGSPDAARLPYWAEISLEQLPAGRYVLQVMATDRTTGTNAVERINFVVE